MKLEADEGKQKLEQLALWLEREHPSAAASLREGAEELFTINRLDLPPRLKRCLATTNLIDSTHSGVRQKTHRVTNWKNGAMVLRWSAAAFLATERNSAGSSVTSSSGSGKPTSDAMAWRVRVGAGRVAWPELPQPSVQ